MADEATTTEEQEPVRSGWFRSPGGVLSHADGPSQVRVFTERGYAKVDDAAAVEEVGNGVQLRVERADAKGTFDDVRAAVREESGGRRRPTARRSKASGETSSEG